MGSTRFLLCILAALCMSDPLAAAGRIFPPLHRQPLTITARPDTVRPQVGQVVRVRVLVSGARRVASVPFSLAYDPAVLEFVADRSVEGGFLRRGGSSTSFLARDGRVRDGRTAVVVGLSRLGGGPAAGRGVLCELAFRVRAPGVSPLSFVNGRALSPAAEPLEARFVDGVVRAGGVP